MCRLTTNHDADDISVFPLQVVDGWEMNGQLFPSDEDHPLSFNELYRVFCDNRPLKFVSHQNVAMLQWKIPVTGQGFTVRVRFFYNPKREYTCTHAHQTARC